MSADTLVTAARRLLETTGLLSALGSTDAGAAVSLGADEHTVRECVPKGARVGAVVRPLSVVAITLRAGSDQLVLGGLHGR